MKRPTRRRSVGVPFAAALAGAAVAVASLGGNGGPCVGTCTGDGGGLRVGFAEASTRGHRSHGRSVAAAGSVPSLRPKHYSHDHRVSFDNDDSDGGSGTMSAGGGGGGSSDSEGDVFDTDDEHYDDEDDDLLFVEASSAWSMRVGAGGASGEKEGDSEAGTSASGGGADEGADEQDTADAAAAAAAANEASTTEASEGAGQSQPLRTLKKLQAMLDDSDYATAATASLPVESPTAGTAAAAAKLAFGDDAAMATQQAVPAVATTSTSVSSQQPLPPPPPLPPVPSQPKPQQQRSQQPEKLWTSKDRSKYKKQRRLRQERERREKEQLEEQRRKWQQAGLSSSEDGDESTRKGTADGNHGAAAAAAVAATVATDTDDDGFLTDGTTTEDDGLGYSLPNLPVYLSDSEGNSDDFELLDDEEEGRGGPPPPTAQQFQQQQQQAYVQQQQSPPLSQSQYQYQPQGQQSPPSSAAAGYNQLIDGNHQQPLPGDPYQQAYPQYNPYQYYQQQQQGGQYSQPPPMNYPYPYPNQYTQQQYAQYAQQYAAWAAAAAAAQATSGGSNGYPPPSLPPQSRQQPQRGPTPYQQSNYNNNVQRPYPQQHTQGGFMPQPYAVAPRPSAGQGSTGSPRNTKVSASTKANGKSKKSNANVAPSQYQSQGNGSQDVFPPQQQVPPAVPFVPRQPMPMEMMHVTDYSQEVSLAEASANISFDSIQKLVFVMVGVMLMSYCAVSPRTLPVVEYNMRFKENLQIVSLVLIAPVIISISVFDAKESDINRAISTFTSTFTLGYVMCFVCEVVWTTILRLGVFLVWEPQIFKLTPRVPMVVLPWVLRENKYRPKRITLFAADFATSCVAAPIIEEYIKLKLVQLGGRLPRNYRKVKKKRERDASSNKNKAKKKRKRYALEKIERAPGEAEVTNVNVFVTQMLAASVGLKLCDSARRILMYTKRTDASKSFYAFARGVFPIHELCGTMTAIELAKRDLLGVDMPLWRILLPAVFIHGMANFRGMKPLFKWNSSTPWSEMQLSPWNVADDSTLGQMVSKGLAKLMWLIILGRVLGYCIKNYYLVKRQAIKRTTTYAGKQAAFSAELAAAQYLKKTKKQKGKNNQD